MKNIQLRDAKANLSAVVDEATHGKPSVITRHGKPQAVVVGYDQWKKLSSAPSFGRLLMAAPLASLAQAPAPPTEPGPQTPPPLPGSRRCLAG